MARKQIKLVAVLAVMLAATLVMSTNSKAADLAPGEGFYVGAFVGHGTGIVSAKVESFATTNGAGRRGTFESDRGGFGLSGMQGGGWLGWGMKTADDIYFGTEAEFAGSDEKIKLTSSVAIQDDDGELITSLTAKRNWQGGAAVRVGYYVNSNTLFSLKGGLAVSQFGVKIGTSDKTYYAGGPQVGASMETKLSKLDPNLSLRMEWVFTDYLTADMNGQDGVGKGTGNNSTITGHDSAGRIGVTYNF